MGSASQPASTDFAHQPNRAYLDEADQVSPLPPRCAVAVSIARRLRPHEMNCEKPPAVSCGAELWHIEKGLNVAATSQARCPRGVEIDGIVEDRSVYKACTDRSEFRVGGGTVRV